MHVRIGRDRLWGKFVYEHDDRVYRPFMNEGREDAIIVHQWGKPVSIGRWLWHETNFSHETGYNNSEVQSTALRLASKMVTADRKKQVHVIFSLGYDKKVAPAAGLVAGESDPLLRAGVIKIHQLETTEAGQLFNQLVADRKRVVLFLHVTC